jgi:hypothetical protein
MVRSTFNFDLDIDTSATRQPVDRVENFEQLLLLFDGRRFAPTVSASLPDRRRGS